MYHLNPSPSLCTGEEGTGVGVGESLEEGEGVGVFEAVWLVLGVIEKDGVEE